MKKVFLTLFTLTVILASCKCKKAVLEEDKAAVVMSSNENLNSSMGSNQKETDKQQQGALVKYSANSRGYHLEVVFSEAGLSFTTIRDSKDFKSVKISQKDQDELVSLVKQINPEDLQKLEAPTMLRLHDGAAHADFQLIKNGITYNSTGFDHGHPPAKIEKLINKLVSFTE